MSQMSNEERIGKIETEVAVVSAKLDNLSQSLHGINESLRQQTEILSKFIAYQQKQDHLEDEVSKIKTEIKESKEKLSTGMGWLRGVIAAGTVALVVGQGIGAYVIKDKIEMLNSISERVAKMELSGVNNNKNN